MARLASETGFPIKVNEATPALIKRRGKRRTAAEGRCCCGGEFPMRREDVADALAARELA